jgi:hypothetical protein
MSVPSVPDDDQARNEAWEQTAAGENQSREYRVRVPVRGKLSLVCPAAGS